MWNDVCAYVRTPVCVAARSVWVADPMTNPPGRTCAAPTVVRGI